MIQEDVLQEILLTPPSKRDTIPSYAYFVLHGKSDVARSNSDQYVPFENSKDVDGFLEFHPHQIGVLDE
jgi:hypothetical protein